MIYRDTLPIAVFFAWLFKILKWIDDKCNNSKFLASHVENIHQRGPLEVNYKILLFLESCRLSYYTYGFSCLKMAAHDFGSSFHFRKSTQFFVNHSYLSTATSEYNNHLDQVQEQFDWLGRLVVRNKTANFGQSTTWASILKKG